MGIDTNDYSRAKEYYIARIAELEAEIKKVKGDYALCLIENDNLCKLNAESLDMGWNEAIEAAAKAVSDFWYETRNSTDYSPTDFNGGLDRLDIAEQRILALKKGEQSR